jgi:hypothetical protein
MRLTRGYRFLRDVSPVARQIDSPGPIIVYRERSRRWWRVHWQEWGRLALKSGGKIVWNWVRQGRSA